MHKDNSKQINKLIGTGSLFALQKTNDTYPMYIKENPAVSDWTRNQQCDCGHLWKTVTGNKQDLNPSYAQHAVLFC